MLSNILNLRSVQISLTSLIILGAIFCIFTPNYFLFKMGSRFAILIMLGYLVMGILFLMAKQQRLMFTSMACCAGLCLFLKHASNSDLQLPLATDELSIKVAHFNVSASDTDDQQSTLHAMLETDADLISIQEVTPPWRYALKETLTEQYPYSATIVRMDLFGLAVFSKFPFHHLDTFYYADIPNFSGVIETRNQDHRFKFICAHTNPPLYSRAYEEMKGHLEMIAEQSTRDSMAVIMISNFNAPPWWAEIQDLRETARLNDSRRSSAYGFSEIFQSPSDYILYTDDFNCLGFENIISPQSSHLGIQGRYQFKYHDKKEN